jgi:hypothetical protein
MSVRDQLVREISNLSESELQHVAEYLAFLKFRNRISAAPAIDETQLAALYAEFAEEDSELAEEGMAEYAQSLAQEDDE